jgi:ribonucleoside-triphosphate reductase
MHKIISDEFTRPYLNRPVPWGFNGLGEVVYQRTYSRIKDDGTKETWPETIQRCINGAQEIGADYTAAEAKALFDHMFNLRCSFGGRMLWQLGTPTVARYGLASLLNCWYVAMREPEDLCFLFEHLMLGGGVGFSVERQNVHEWPRVKAGVTVTHLEGSTDADFIVPDSRQGWVELVRKTLDAYFNTGKSFTYSTVLIRTAGAPIKGFGGTASGPRILVEGIRKIADVLDSRSGKKVRSIDVLDMGNIIGSVVVAGNVRRSAEIAIGDPDDYLFLRAKRWDLGNVPNHRAMSNNSVIADSFDQIPDAIWAGFNGNGEPYGFLNTKLARTYGRLGEAKPDRCEGFNPCAEIPLEDGEACNLSEIFLPNVESWIELHQITRLLWKAQKAVWNLPALYDKTTKVVKRNRRIGMGVTGVMQAGDKCQWLEKAYRNLKNYDATESAKRKIPESVRLTTVKPSGTLSLLAGVTPGVHPAFSQYYIRRVRMAADDPLVKTCRESGYKVEFVRGFDGKDQHDTVVVEFPCESGGATTAGNLSALDQLEWVKFMQTNWADNAVSVTVYFKPEEVEDIKLWLKDNYEHSIKSVSFLPLVEHGFDQAPYERIDRATYERLCSKIQPRKAVAGPAGPDGPVLDLECEGGACPVR